jgi:hypothetical protein
MTIPYNHNTPDVVVYQYCLEDFEKESPYIRYVYKHRRDSDHHDAVIICTTCFNDLSNRNELVGIRSKTLPSLSPYTDIIYWEFTKIDIMFS